MRFYYLLCTTILSYGLFAQVTVGESFSSKFKLSTDELPVKTLNYSFESLKTEPLNGELRLKPLKVAEGIEVNDAINEVGVWNDLGNGDVLWRMKYSSDNAKYFIVQLKDLVLNDGAELNFYSDDAFYGGITNKLDLSDRLMTDIISGKNITIELKKRSNDTESGFIVHSVQAGNLAKFAAKNGQPTLRVNESANCEYDADCAPGSTLENEKKGIARLLFGQSSGTNLCSGALMNNTTGDKTPYLLSAYHCFGGFAINGNFYSLVTINYKAATPLCPRANQSATVGNTFYNYNAGMKVIAKYSGADMALMKFNTAVDSNWDVYFNGWDRSDAAVPNAKNLHHPSGDVMKVSVENQALTQQAVNIEGQVAQSWIVSDWDIGVTEGGSSGSPLFDPNNKVIGQLFGGSSFCNGATGDNGASDFYGRLGVAWNGGGSANTRLSDWLDPNNTGANTINGKSNILGVDDIDKNETSFNVYPNPTNSFISFEPDNNNDYIYEIVNVAGQYIRGEKANGKVTINVESLSTGVYFVKFYQNGKVVKAEKFIKN